MANFPVPESSGETKAVITFAGQTSVDFDFYVVRSEQMDVRIMPAAGGDQVILDPASFTVSGIGNQNGGSVALIGVATVPGDVVLMRRVTPIERKKEWQNEGDYKAELVNDEQDEIYLIMQELQRNMGRAVMVQPGEDPPTAGQVDGWVSDAVTASSEAKTARDYARQWASNPENTPVNDGVNPEGFSAFSHSKKSSASATTSAASALASEQSKVASVNAANASAASAADAAASQTGAASSAVAASAAAYAANESAGDAEAARDDAAAAAVLAGGRASDASASASSALASKNAAASSEEAASSAATGAASSAAAALASKNAAADSEASANASRVAAEASKDAAATSASGASTSADDALASQQAALASASAASGSATTAASSASSAADASGVASGSATAAASSASAASASAARSITAEGFSYQWASSPENQPVDDGTHQGFSAYHWSKKAEQAAGGGVVSVASGDGVDVDNSDVNNPIVALSEASKASLAKAESAVQPGAIGTAASLNAGAASGNVPVLDGAGKLLESTIPAVAITDTFVVASQADMLALDVQRGDIAVRSDINKSFVLQAAPASTLANWIELRTPTDAVLSVNGKTGAVTLAKGDVGLGSVDNTADNAKPVSTPQAAAINAKVTKANDTGLGGFAANAKALGNLLGSLTPTHVGGNYQAGTITGALTINAPTAPGVYDLKIELLIGAGAGAVTLAGFGNTDFGEAFTTAAGDFFVLQIEKGATRTIASVRKPT